MATFTKSLLSNSVDGKGIKVSATTQGAGTLIHSAPVSGLHEVWLYAVNTSGADTSVTIEWATPSAPDANITSVIPANSGPILIAPGLLIAPNMSSYPIAAYAGTADVVIIHGYANIIV